MDIHTATEQAYKNGYNKGYADGIAYAKEQLENLKIPEFREIKVVPCTHCTYNLGTLRNPTTGEYKIRCVVDGYSMEKLVPEDHACTRGER